MSKAPLRKRHTHRGATLDVKPILPIDEGLKKNLFIVVAVVVFAGIPFTLGKYFEFSVADAFDGGSYAYSAKHVLSGARIGYEEKPSAQAGTLLVNMLGVALSGFNETGAEILQTLLQVAALTFMFITVRRLYGTLAAVVSVAVASVYLSAPLIAKFGNVKEQFMIAFMILGICCFVFYRLSGKWWWVLLTGALLVWGPMFKQTGVSAIGAVGLFTLAQPILRRENWTRTGRDILLLVAGAAVVLVPICAWYVSMDASPYYWPYSFVFAPMLKLVGVDLAQAAEPAPAQEPAARSQEVQKGDDSLILKLLPGYVSDSWRMLGPAERKEAFRRVLRYYGLLILPIVLALGAIFARVVVLLRARHTESRALPDEDTGRFVPLFALWWFFDMAFVWISPHSYEQYYLPLNASGAMLGGYLVGLYAHRLHAGRDRARWVVLGLLGLVLVIAMSWRIFFGISKSPHSGSAYGRPSRGYLQKWQEVRAHPQYDWLRVGDYIRQHSEPTDTIYVWGWVPGIYVRAQRMSPTPKAFEGTMHTLPPEQLAGRIQEIMVACEKNPPKFIVDTRKRHFPWNRPPLELWPIMPKGFMGVEKPQFLPNNQAVVEAYDKAWRDVLRRNFDEDEALRYEALKPLRKFVMEHYRVVSQFGEEILFARQ